MAILSETAESMTMTDGQSATSQAQSREGAVGRNILLVAPSPPPYGGMALQARILEQQLRGDGHNVVFFPSNQPFPKHLEFVGRLVAVRTLLRTCMIWTKLWGAIHKADVVHVLAASGFYFFAVVWPTVLYARLQRKQVVMNYRGGLAKQFFERFGWAAKPVFAMTSVVSTPSRFLAEAIEDYFHVPVRIVPNILVNEFQFRQRSPLRPRMLVTRHLEEIYDVESVLRAFRRIHQSRPDATLWIAGTGSLEQRLRGLAAEWDLDSSVRFLGHVPHGDLPAVYDQCDILVNASRVDNFPGALLEASGAGLAVVSTCAGGIPFMFDHGKTALLVEPGDWEALAGALEQVLDSPALALSLTTAAAELARGCAWTEVRKSLYLAYGFTPPLG